MAHIKIADHPVWCKCVRCKVGVLDRSELYAIPCIGECQKCHKVIKDVKIGVPCPYCGFGGIDGRPKRIKNSGPPSTTAAKRRRV